jgi:hypothetical protein
LSLIQTEAIALITMTPYGSDRSDVGQ